jgi:hypothetical protein
MVHYPRRSSKRPASNAYDTAVAEILPAGTNPSQTTQVQVRDFGSVVPSFYSPALPRHLVPKSGDATTSARPSCFRIPFA